MQRFSRKLRRSLKAVHEEVESPHMALIPQDAAKRSTFFQTLAPVWAERHAEIGVSEADMVDLKVAVEEARVARAEAVAAAQAAESATMKARLADERMTRLGSLAIAEIKSFAKRQETPHDVSNVFVAAQLPAPGRPGPRHRDQSERNAAVPRVVQVFATPDAQGAVTLRWITHRGASMGAGAGMMYQIAREVDGRASAVIGVVGGPGPGRTSNTFTDTAVPIGARHINYSVTPMQHGGTGTTAIVGVVFGSVRAA